ncbi:hypothetical protein [Achromobacter xylosoxidans]|jgi:hypothetical protein|uniref:hypothetical protein n=1 Tax=Alcaligenes xylosoxydans xylosoxydans TaxID=85698 RepID=UPI001F14055C|nr:hypothetical protein [Achromobacter xylosoxidans]
MSHKLEEDGIVYGLAKACVEATREIADKATPEGFIKQVVYLTRDDNPEHVAQCLHMVLEGLQISLGKTVKVDL